MNIGVVGLGKVGLPVAAVLAARGGHSVTGYDTNSGRLSIFAAQDRPAEEDLDKLLSANPPLAATGSLTGLVNVSDLVIIAVQTPHAPGYGGEQPAPGQRRDYDYTWLIQAVRDTCQIARSRGRRITVAVLSTVLPGTMRQLIAPLGNDYVKLVYAPAFISLGTVIRDFSAPPFVLCGTRDPADASLLTEAYEAVHHAPVYRTGYETAEVAKIAYNMAGTIRIEFANMLGQLCHQLPGADVSQVTSIIGLGAQAGMPDGGACRPRDLIAMSWLTAGLAVPDDLPECLIRAREAHGAWLAALVRRQARITGLPVTILGRAYKPGSDLTAGSPALLLAHYLADLEPGSFDPVLDGPVPDTYPDWPLNGPGVFLIATRYPEFRSLMFRSGSVIIDPWGYIPDRPGVTVIRVGRP